MSGKARDPTAEAEAKIQLARAQKDPIAEAEAKIELAIAEAEAKIQLARAQKDPIAEAKAEIQLARAQKDPIAEAEAKIQLARAQKDPIAEAKAEIQLARAQKDPIAEAEAKIELARAQKDPIAEAEAKIQLARAQKDPIAEAEAKIELAKAQKDPIAEAEAKIELARAQKDPVAEAKAEIQLARAQKDPIAEAEAKIQLAIAEAEAKIQLARAQKDPDAEAEAQERLKEVLKGFQLHGAGAAGEVESGEMVLGVSSLVSAVGIKEAFVQPFISDGSPSRWLSHLVNMARTHCSASNSAPFQALFQSSGYGKTRVLLNGKLGEEGVPRIYIHCQFLEPARSKHQNGYPNPVAGDDLKEAFPAAGAVVKWSEATEKLAHFILALLHRYYCNSDSEPPAPLNVSKKTVEYGPLFDNLGREWTVHGPHFHEQCIKALCQHVKRRSEGNAVVLMIWDEAAAMQLRTIMVEDDRLGAERDTDGKLFVRNVSARPVFRAACRKLHKWLEPTQLRVAHALLATLSNLNAASPSLGASDDSARFMDASFPDHDPMTGLVEEHSDLFPQQEPSYQQPTSVGSVINGERTMCYKAWQLGRPLWSSVKLDTDDGVGNKAHWAARKLFGGKQIGKSCDFTESQALALLFSRVAGLVIPGKLAEHMVESHMATAVEFVKQSKSLYAQYVSEPALAQGSRFILDKSDQTLCSDTFLSRVRAALSSAPPNPGDLGELAACALLLHAYDTREKTKKTADPLASCVSVPDFLDALVGSSWKFLLEQALSASKTRQGSVLKGLKNPFFDRLGSGFVSYNHFVRVGHIDNLEWPRLLYWAWERNAAIICPPGFPGVDLVIPIWYEGSDVSTKVGALPIQVKNTLAAFPSANLLHGSEAIGFKHDSAIFPGVFIGLRMQHEKGCAAKQLWKAFVLGTDEFTPALIAGDLACIACLEAAAVDELVSLCNLHRFRPQFSDRRYQLAKASYSAVTVGSGSSESGAGEAASRRGTASKRKISNASEPAGGLQKKGR